MMSYTNQGQQGFSLVEALVAMMLVATSLLGVLGLYGSSKRSGLAAQRADIAADVARADLDELLRLPYDDLSMSATGIGAATSNRKRACAAFSDRIT